MNVRSRQEALTRLLALGLAGIVFLLLMIGFWPQAGSTTEIAVRFAGALVATTALFMFLTRRDRQRVALRKEPFPTKWENVLNRDVVFFQTLDESEKGRFREEVQLFLSEKRITGIKTSIDDTTRVLVAASAIIPIFGFPGWEWDQINEVLIYPTTFDDEYRTGGKEQHEVLGMVGSGAMNRMMILSKPDLLQGFRSPQDQNNVGIHEFAHLLDKSDGTVDGIPGVALPSNAIEPWLKLVHEEMRKIESGHSDINPYGLTSEAEFFAVVSEYFFENPHKMKEQHATLYTMLERIFQQDPRSRLKNVLSRMVVPNRGSRGHNSLCP